MLNLGYTPSSLAKVQGQWTAEEIAQQPACLRATQAGLTAKREAIEAFLAPVRANRAARVVLTGAGSSAFIGEILAPLLDARLACRVEAVATTDIVAAPGLYLDPAAPTLLVSFARSGNSPESVAAVDLANQLVGDACHLVVTCNGEGALARQVRAAKNAHLVLLPEATHDRGFAMTSSFSAMLLAGLSALGGIERLQARIGPVADAVERTLAGHSDAARELAAQAFHRVIYLGGGPFKGLAREAALKLLELTDGAVMAAHDTPLGFRHGPKTMVNSDSLVAVFLSADPHSRAYDLDLLAELRRDARAGRVLALSGRADPGLAAGDVVLGGEAATDAELAFPYLAFAQMVAFHSSVQRGLTPDNPNRDGLVNRVVQGVAIHPYQPQGGR